MPPRPSPSTTQRQFHHRSSCQKQPGGMFSCVVGTTISTLIPSRITSPNSLCGEVITTLVPASTLQRTWKSRVEGTLLSFDPVSTTHPHLPIYLNVI
ncbi:hypothetical protein FRC19_000807 [Serendipita sp. 401]|nr:hypothetical protein FRC19_000807 [Serendipita sp. 401]